MKAGIRKRRVFRSAAFALLLSLATAAQAGTAFAKYSVVYTNVDTGRVAIFDVTNNFDTLSLFDTVIYEEDGVTPDTDVFSNGVNKLIAPGTGGRFILQLTNNSEVTVEYALNMYLSTGDTIPILFSIDDGATWDQLQNLTGFNTPAVLPAGSTTINVQWRWPFDGNDPEDTGLGMAAMTTAQTVEVQADVYMRQLD